MIKFKNISKSYITKSNPVPSIALTNINLEISQGEIFGIIGSSGAGKSTLLRTVNKLEEPDSGEVWVGRQYINKLAKSKLKAARQEIGMIFQHFNLLDSQNVYHNIIFPLKINHQLKSLSKFQLQNKIAPILSLTGLTELVHKYPNQLSGGQKQRVAIARSLITNPKVLLCDECTSSLDPETTSSILYLLKKINLELGVTILLITHEMDVIKSICQRVAVMSHGAIVETGSVLEVLTASQHEITKTMLSRNLIEKLPAAIRNNIILKNEYNIKVTLGALDTSDYYPLLELIFINKTAAQPILSSIMREYNVAFNILQGEIETVQDSLVGRLIVHLEASAHLYQQIQTNLNAKGINIEIVGYAPRIY